MATKKAKAESGPIQLPKLEIKRMKVRLKGDSPLVVHAWSKKAKDEMLAKQMKKAKGAKEAKDPARDYEACFYRMPDGKPGFPVIAFKAAAVDACSMLSGITKVEARGAFHIDGELTEILGAPRMREDMVRIAMGTADIRFRPEFPEWRVVLTIRYNANVLSPEQIANLFTTAGFSIGVGEHRPQRDGQWGMFHVEGFDVE